MQGNGTSTVVTLLLLMATGLLMKKTSVLNKNAENSIAKIIQNYCVPSLMLYNVTQNFSMDFLSSNKSSLLIVLLSYAIMFISAFIVTKVFKINKERYGIFTAMFSFSNTIFIGVPIITGVFGEKGLPFLMLYYLVNTFVFWSLGVYLIGMDSGRKFFSMDSLKKILNPGIISFFIGLYFLYTKTQIPTPLLKGFNYMSSMVTPLSTLYMGSVIADLKLGDLHYVKDTVLILLGRFIWAPLVTFFLMKHFGMGREITSVFVVASSLPVMTQVSVTAGNYGKDNKYAAFMTTLTTILYVFVIPLYFNYL